MALHVSIPKRVSEVLWRQLKALPEEIREFQSLKGFQRFCGSFRAGQQLLVGGFNP